MSSIPSSLTYVCIFVCVYTCAYVYVYCVAIIDPWYLSFRPALYARLTDGGAGAQTAAPCAVFLCGCANERYQRETAGLEEEEESRSLLSASCLLVVLAGIAAIFPHTGSNSCFHSSSWTQPAPLPTVTESVSCRDAGAASPAWSQFQLLGAPSLSF